MDKQSMNYDKKLDWQKSHPELKISYYLDYDPASIWEIPGTSEEIRKLPFYIQEIGMTIAHNKYYVRRTGLESYMLCYITGGSMSLAYEGKETIIKPDSVFWLDCINPHTLALPKNEHELRCFFVHFYGSGAILYKKYLDSLEQGCILQLAPGNLILSYIQQLLKEYTEHKRSIMTDLEASTLLSNICYAIVDEARDKAKATIPDSISKIRDYLTTCYNDEITLETLSSKYFLSPSYLQKQFKKYVGLSPLEYLTRVRIAESKKLLRTTSLSIHEIAERVGFSDPSYFVQVFHKRENMTPLKYKKLWFSDHPMI